MFYACPRQTCLRCARHAVHPYAALVHAEYAHAEHGHVMHTERYRYQVANFIFATLQTYYVVNLLRYKVATLQTYLLRLQTYDSTNSLRYKVANFKSCDIHSINVKKSLISMLLLRINVTKLLLYKA
jgi:hypothetical protein